MSGLQLNVTPEGRAAIVNAENTGTGPVLIAQVGITASGDGLVGGALAGELKRLVTFAGAAVADDTMHVTIRDDSTDVYSLHGFALYLQDGTLFAWYAQAGVILEKSAQAMMMLANDVRFSDLNATTLSFGDTNWINPPGTTEAPGVLELATDAETTAGVDNQRAVRPAGLKAALDARFGVGAPSAFVKGLLNLATAPMVRAALSLGSAALRNEGTGNGLDADKLDGQDGSYYLSWANQTGKPVAFAPTAHAHIWADITNPPATALRWPDWLEVVGKPATFTPAAHTHAAADITSGTLSLARIPALPVEQVVDLQASLDAKVAKTGDEMTGGLSWSTAPGVSPTDLSKHIKLHSFGYGFSITSGSLNYVVGQVSGKHAFYVSGAKIAEINVNGLQAITIQATTSDARLKTEIKPLRDCVDLIMRLLPRSYRWRSSGESDFGFIAQEHAQVLPEAVHQASAEEDGEPGLMSVRYGKVEPYLVGAIQELARRLDAIESTIAGRKS